MGRRGPKKTPVNLQKLRGNPGKRPLPGGAKGKKGAAPPPPEAPVPPPPAWLAGETARRYWEWLAPRLAGQGLLEEIDHDHLAALCDAWQEVADCDAVLADIGAYQTTESGFIVLHPAVNRRTKALERVRKLSADFGMSPAARASLGHVPPGPPSALGKFLTPPDPAS